MIGKILKFVMWISVFDNQQINRVFGGGVLK